MALRLVRASDLVRRPWKNGGGATAELAVGPEGADFDGFDWRISMADVEADGPFSAFAEVDRTLVLLQGKGIMLDIGGTPHRLDAASPLISFPGDAPTIGRLIAGPIRDFNVMTRRSRFAHQVRFVANEAVHVRHKALLLAHAGPVTVLAEGTIFILGALDALFTDSPLALGIDGAVLLAFVDPPAAG